jgi:hypothetical protein
MTKTKAPPSIKIPTKQTNQYDKILQEGIEGALPGLIKNVLKINVVGSEELPDKLQYTIEREPDILKKITDDKGREFILHAELQTTDDNKMIHRMLAYWALILMKYELPVLQYVIYIGKGKSRMPNKLQSRQNHFQYNLISISSVDYRIFLRSKNPDEKLLAILGDFGKDKPATALSRIATEIVQSTQGDLEKERRKNQLRILAKLRNLALEDIDIMKHITIPFKKEEDIFYKVGQQEGQNEERINRNTEFVTNLLLADKFTIAEIANFASVDEAFVKKVRAKLKQKN